MEKWEYFTGFFIANIDNEGVKEFLNRRWSDWKSPPEFTPETMIPRLNRLGEQGWELVHMQPVAGQEGKNGDVFFNSSPEFWNRYFCVFKRRMPG